VSHTTAPVVFVFAVGIAQGFIPAKSSYRESGFLSAEGRSKAQRTCDQNNFFKFSPEIACQAPKPPNPMKSKKIELAC
jgi:hypothetical protein